MQILYPIQNPKLSVTLSNPLLDIRCRYVSLPIATLIMDLSAYPILRRRSSAEYSAVLSCVYSVSKLNIGFTIRARQLSFVVDRGKFTRLYQRVKALTAQPEIDEASIVDAAVFYPFMYRKVLLQVPEIKFSSAAIAVNFRLQNRVLLCMYKTSI